MRYFTALPTKLCCVVFLSFVLQSCGPGDPGTWRNDEINSGKRNDFHELNSQLFKALKNGNAHDVENMASKELLESNAFNRTMELVANRLKTNDYNVFDEYYIIHKLRGIQTINAANLGINNYTLNYEAVTEEMYIVLFTPKTGLNKYMISVGYAKYDYGWRICSLGVEPYTAEGKTAPELFKDAKTQYNKGYLADAVNTMTLALDCLHPGQQMWQYPGDHDMRMFYITTSDEANNKYKFPLVMKQIPTQPQIFRITTQAMPEGTFPTIYYQSKINLKDTNAIKREHEDVKKVIGSIIPGIDKEKKYVLYSVFNKKPESKKTVPSFDITDKL